MTYGQTGSGKTFTMMGDAQSYEHRGIAPRAINQLFNDINSRIEFDFKVTCTYMEIYNERIFDLLTDLSSPDQAADYTIAEEKDGRGTFVRGLAEVEVRDENSTLNLLFSGGLSRTIATHKLNKRSNRSHSIFTIYLQQRQRSGVSEKIVHSKLHLVDLAGSERLKKTMDSIDGSTGDEVTRKESMAINQSLTYLEQCVVALARRGQSHIPYRQSKLTNILKDCLGANCNTVMLACMWGESSHLEETISTLRLASRMMRVQNETASVQTIDPSALIKKQDKIIRALKQELLMHDALVERTGVGYDPYTPEQQDGVAQMLEQYIEATELEEEAVLSISSYRQMLEVCKQFKRKVLAARAEAQQAREQALLGGSRGLAGSLGPGRGGSAQGGGADLADSLLAEEFDPRAAPVGEPLGGAATGFHLGAARSDSRPPNGVEGLARFDPAATLPAPSPLQKGVNFSSAPSPSRPEPDLALSQELDLGGGSVAQFEAFVRGDEAGRQMYAAFREARGQLKEARARGRDLGTTVNAAKAIIDQLQQELEASRAARLGAGKDSSSGREAEQELREAKAAYKSCFEALQRAKSGALEAQATVNGLRAALGSGFSRWTRGAGPEKLSSTTTAAPGPGMGSEERDQLDDQEAFDKLEIERVLANDPESLAFFHAQKTRRAHMTQNGGSLRQIQKNKRFV